MCSQGEGKYSSNIFFFWLSVAHDCDGCSVMGTEAMVKAQCFVNTFFFPPMLFGGTTWLYISWTRSHPSCLPHGDMQQSHLLP